MPFDVFSGHLNHQRPPAFAPAAEERRPEWQEDSPVGMAA